MQQTQVYYQPSTSQAGTGQAGQQQPGQWIAPAFSLGKLWCVWVFATAGGGVLISLGAVTICLFLLTFMAYALSGQAFFYLWLLVPLLLPVLLGHVQAAILDRYDTLTDFRQAWKRASWKGLLFTLPIAFLLIIFPEIVPRNVIPLFSSNASLSPFIATIAGLSALLGMFVGWGQAKAYAPLRVYRGWWAAANALGWGLGWLLAMMSLAPISQPLWFLGFLSLLLTPWLCGGIITGSTLVVLLRRASSPARQASGRISLNQLHRLWILGTVAVGTFAQLNVQLCSLYLWTIASDQNALTPWNSYQLLHFLTLFMPAITPICAGLIQALLLSRYHPRTRIWRQWNAISCSGSFLLILPMQWYATLNNTGNPFIWEADGFWSAFLVLFFGTALVGLYMGWMQSRVYLPLRPFARRWMLSSALAWGLGWALGWHVIEVMFTYLSPAPLYTMVGSAFDWLRLLLISSIPWLIIAVTTGNVLHRLLNKSTQSTAGSGQTVP